MTLTFMRRATALALALSLAACGGKATFPVSGTISGLVYDGLVLSTNGMDLTVPKDSKKFTFPNALSYGEVYNVVVKANSQPAHQTCTVASFVDPTTGIITNGPTDTAGRFGAINIGVSCTINAMALGGTVKGLASGATLQLINGSDGTPVTVTGTATDAATGIAFALANVPFDKTYGITVFAQPAGQVCTVSNGTGQMTDVAPTNIVVNCQ
jgi:hypothetical protein